MPSFHAKDTRHALEWFSLTSTFFKEETDLNRKKRNRRDGLSQDILERLKPSLMGQPFPEEAELLSAIEELVERNEFRRIDKKWLIQKARQFKRAEIENFGLQFTRFLSTRRDEEGKISFILPEEGDEQLVFPAKAAVLVEALLERENARLKSYAQSSPLRQISGTLDWRMIVGLGNEHIKETNMTLHHIYGIPYIPGSAVKGLVRQYVLHSFLEPECRVDPENRMMSEKDFQKFQQRYPVEALGTLLVKQQDGSFLFTPNALTEEQRNAWDESLLNARKAAEEEIRKKYVERLDVLDNALAVPNLERIRKDQSRQELEKQLTISVKDKSDVKPLESTLDKILAGWDSLERFQQILGTQEQRGAAIFFDAYPESLDDKNFEIDLMNPHHSKYYASPPERFPNDCESPIPVTFLTVANASFKFYIGCQAAQGVKAFQTRQSQEALLDEISQWLQSALPLYGIGAKTSVGYGYFKEVMSVSNPKIWGNEVVESPKSFSKKKGKHIIYEEKREIASDNALQELMKRFNK